VTDKYKCATVKIEKANVRTGPGTNYGINVISPAMKYTSFKIIGSKKGWMQLMDEYGDKGWIYEKLLWTP
jgi:SH3-like domain-containing protein